MNIPKNYRKPITIAVILHIALLFFLIFNFAPTMFRMPPSSAVMKTVQATAISEASVQAEMRQVQQQTEAQTKAQQLKKEQMEAQAKAIRMKSEALAEAIKMKSEALAEANAKKAQEKLAQQKAMEHQKHLQELARASAASKLKAQKLVAEQKQLQQALIQQQIMSEQKNLTQVQSLAQQGAIDKYKAEILAAIQSNWRIDQINSKLKCIYSVTLAPDGTVLSLKLVQGSGDTTLDQSAKQAINLASPLPVPHNPVLFNHFRQLILTLSPQGILQSVASA